MRLTTSDPTDYLCCCSPKESFISQTINAFDFAEVRSKKDRELLYEAKYGERGPDVSDKRPHSHISDHQLPCIRSTYNGCRLAGSRALRCVVRP